jgi:hypothetical protein
MPTDYTREDLLAICERAFVPQDKWLDRDSSDAQRQLGECYALLKAGCDFAISRGGSLVTDDRTIWVSVVWEGFAHFDWGGPHDRETYYLPTDARLDAVNGGDWY